MALDFGITPLPGGAVVFGPEDAAVWPHGAGVHDVRGAGAKGDPDAPNRTRGEPAANPAPALSTVLAPEEAALGSSPQHAPLAPLSLEGRGKEHVGIPGVHAHLHDPRLVADLQHLRPVGASIGGAEKPPLRVGAPERAHSRYEDHIGVLGMDEDPPHMATPLQPHVAPRRPSIVGPVDAVTVGRTPDAVLLAGPHPDDVRVGRSKGDGAQGHAPLVLEHGPPGSAGVLRLPCASRSRRRENDAGVPGVHGEGGDPSTGDSRTQFAPGEGAQVGGPKGLTGILRLGLGRLGWEKERGGTGEACEDRAKVNGADRRCRLHLKPRL